MESKHGVKEILGYLKNCSFLSLFFKVNILAES